MPKVPILCRVQALHSFASSDPSSLSFGADDYIDVLRKLDSGWWDGWCNGARGWFPSNYVRVVKDYTEDDSTPPALNENSDSGSEKTNDHQNVPPTPRTQNGVLLRKNSGYRLSLPDLGVDDSELDVDLTTLSPEWTMQRTEDGTGCYFYNVSTGEMRITHPLHLDDDQSDDEDNPRFPALIASVDSDDNSDIADHSGFNIGHMGNFPITSKPTGGHWDDQSVLRDSDLDKNAPPTSPWISRKTRDGRMYYHNIDTEETIWDRPDDFVETPSLSTLSLHDQGYSLLKRSTEFSPSPTVDISEPLTWNKISAQVALSIYDLNYAAKSDDISLCHEASGSVANTVRLMLIASGLIDRESEILRTNSAVQAPLRGVTASTCKLALTGQRRTASCPGNAKQLLAEADDLMSAARTFVTACQEASIPVQHACPQLVNNSEEMRKRRDFIPGSHRMKHALTREVVDNLVTCGATLGELTKTLLAGLQERLHIPSRDEITQPVFPIYRDLVCRSSKFQAIVSDTELSPLKDTMLYAKMQDQISQLTITTGDLLVEIQYLSSYILPLNVAMSHVRMTVYEYMQTVDGICDTMRDLLAGDLMRRGSIQSKGSTERAVYADDGEQSEVSVDGTFSPNNGSQFDTSRRGSIQPLSEPASAAPTVVSSAGTINSTDTTNSKMLVRPKLTEEHREVSANKIIDEQAWFLGEDYGPDEIVFSSNGQVKGGTLRALVELLTLHDHLDRSFISTFLLTYRSFCTSMEFLTLLKARYNLVPPEGMDSEENEQWQERKLKLVRLRVFNVLKNWVELYYNEDDFTILNELMDFTMTSIRPTLSSAAEQLLRLINKRMQVDPQDGLKKMILTLPKAPVSILPRNRKNFRLMDLDPLELARQLTVLDFKLYSSIRPVECLDKAWSQDTAEDCLAVNIRSSIEYCNQVTAWVSDAILSQPEIRKRSSMIKYWVSVAEKCRLLNNFNTCMAILSAFDNSSIGRLKRTWEVVGTRTMQTLAHIRKLMGANRNFTEYRAIIHSINPPCIPFLGIYLQDLTFIEDGNANCLKQSKDLINFAKRAKAAEVIREIQQYQSSLYPLKPVEEIRVFILDSLKSTRDEEILYKESLKLEPKEREDEKVTRLLQEQGFL